MPAPERDPADDAPKRIAFVITRSDAVGGAQVHVCELARALADAGHKVAVFVGGEGPYVDRLRKSNVPVWPIPDLIRAVRPARDARGLRQLSTALRAFNPDLVTTHSTKAGWWGRILGRRLRVPVVGVAHGWLLTPGALKPWQQLARIIEWTVAHLCERIIVVSEYDRRIALEHRIAPDETLAVVHNSLPDAPPELLATPRASPPRIVMVARFDWPKDPVVLLEALGRLRDKPWTLELIGDGPDRADVEAAIRANQLTGRVTLLGSRDDVAQRLSEAQVFVLSSKREGFPVSVLEAMRAGLPVVASDVGGISEAVADGITGAMVEPGSPGAMADALAPLLDSAELRDKQGSSGRRRFLEHFAFEQHVRRTWSVYADAMQRNRQTPRPA